MVNFLFQCKKDPMSAEWSLQRGDASLGQGKSVSYLPLPAVIRTPRQS